MKGKLLIYLILLLLLIIAAWFAVRQRPAEVKKIHNTRMADRGDQFLRDVQTLKYTRHAKCRMECRQISDEEVKDILAHGTVNPAKTDLKDRPCPTYALEGITRQDRQRVRIVFAQCEEETRVVTCIDLDREFTCHCN